MIMGFRSDRVLKGAAAAWLIGLAGGAVAQTAANGNALEEIVVTAQKREQNSQDIGISLSAINGADLNALGATQATDITKSMPAVVLTQPNGPSSFSLAIRGVTQNDFADHQESPAAIYVDDVYVSQMAGLAFSLFDIDRIEVLRGPQGTLFGRNATGGLANFVTRRPDDTAGGYVDVTFGERNLTRVEGALNAPLTDSIDARLSYLSNHYDPLFRNTAGGAADAENGNDWALRGQLLFKLPNAGRLLLNLRASREDVHAGSWEEYATKGVGNGVDEFVGANENVYGCPGCNATGLTNSGPFVTRDNISGFAKLRTSGLTAKYSQDLGFSTLTVIGDYSHLSKVYQEDSDASPYTLFQFFNGSQVGQESLEARLNGGDNTFNWTAGLYALRIDGKYYEGWQGPAFFTAQQFNVAGNPNAGYVPGAWPYGDASTLWTTGGVPGPDGGVPATVSPYALLTKSYAAFGQVEWRLNDLIGFVVGARFTRDIKDYQFDSYPYEYFPQDASGATLRLSPLEDSFSSYRGSRGDSLVAGKAQVDFHLTPDMLAYVSYNRGVKGGGFNAPLFPFTINDTATLNFKPETLTSYEAGFKSEWFDHTLRFNAAAYFYDYKNYQALIYTIGLEQLIVNADAVHTGGEMEVQWAPTESWRFGGGVAYVDALVKNVPARCCSDTGEPIYGNYTPGNAPRWTANAMARYSLPLLGGHLALQVDGNYLTRFWFNLSDVPAVEQSGYGVGNARVSFAPQGEKWEVGASVENIANRHYGVMGFDNTAINGLAQVYPGMPRWWKLHVNYKF
jgi:iron complex outermembrane receptor protein